MKPGEDDPKLKAEENEDANDIDDEADAGPDDEVDPAADIDDGSDGDADEGGPDHEASDASRTDEGEEAGRTGQVSRGNRQFGELRRKAREAEQERDRLKAELESTRRPTGKTPEQIRAEEDAERERIRLLPPEDQIVEWRKKDRQEFDARLQGIQFQIADSADRGAFTALCQSDPAVAAVKDEVENLVQQLRRNGGNTARETAAYYLIGKKASERAKTQLSKQRRNGAARIERQTVKGNTNSRGDVPRGDRRETNERAARAKRLENVQI